jgi:hypothetical protein
MEVQLFGGETGATLWSVKGSGQFHRHGECPKVTDAILEVKHH